MSKAIEEANETVTKLEVAIAGAKTAITKSEKSIKKDNKSLEQFSKDLEAKETESSELLQVAGEGVKNRMIRIG
jgi:hypothetical protein